ncbi:MAG TPA: tRNA (adenosine(37)-N6)-threonylcarbamoyltransferase complex transferase subunit TsaD [Candidatus Levybacteria bacterium]|nr:tRNA (adenosine(37)-N6)-threonylcarbamoyltransferase complex transferase subunit TsaD [Candidatus Levybacteria bacterium]
MKILAIESSCDETSAAVVEKIDGNIIVHSNITASSLSTHAKTGGIIPENAAREQVQYIIPVITQALIQFKNHTNKSDQKQINDFKNASDILKNTIDAIAITHGPGLIGSLLVGVETAKTLCYIFEKPLIPVNHLLAHIFANCIESEPFLGDNQKLKIIHHPFIGLIVSGGHTDLLYFKNVQEFTWLGGTRDDAAGEALDKIGRLLGLSYPAGPEIEQRAIKGIATKIRFHAPLLGVKTYDFSFSGLKSEVMRFTQQHTLTETMKNEICFAVQKAVVDVLCKKTLDAAEQFSASTILLGGGVSANSELVRNLKLQIENRMPHTKVFAPEKKYCTDNAAMIGTYALLNPSEESWKNVHAAPDLYFA